MIDNLPNVAGELFDRSIPARLNLAEGGTSHAFCCSMAPIVSAPTAGC
ncbi:hypothetical protein [Pseudomonas aeruginosa]